MKHDFDHDMCCLHCGMDGADWPRSAGPLPPCPVWDEDTRAENLRRYPLHDDISEEEMLEQEYDYRPDDYITHRALAYKAFVDYWSELRRQGHLKNLTLDSLYSNVYELKAVREFVNADQTLSQERRYIVRGWLSNMVKLYIDAKD